MSSYLVPFIKLTPPPPEDDEQSTTEEEHHSDADPEDGPFDFDLMMKTDDDGLIPDKLSPSIKPALPPCDECHAREPEEMVAIVSLQVKDDKDPRYLFNDFRPIATTIVETKCRSCFISHTRGLFLHRDYDDKYVLTIIPYLKWLTKIVDPLPNDPNNISETFKLN